MRSEELRRELEIWGLQMLWVSQHHSNPDVLVVYLNGNVGQWANGFARHLIGTVSGVHAVEEAVTTSSILLVLAPMAGGD